MKIIRYIFPKHCKTRIAFKNLIKYIKDQLIAFGDYELIGGESW